MKNKQPSIFEALQGIAKFAQHLQDMSEKMEAEGVEAGYEPKRPVIKAMVDSREAGAEGEVHTLEGEIVICMALKDTDKGLQVSQAIVGSFGIEDLARAIESIDALRDTLIEKFVEKNLESEVGLTLDPVKLFAGLMGGKR
jgi:hypothetical protein